MEKIQAKTDKLDIVFDVLRKVNVREEIRTASSTMLTKRWGEEEDPVLT